MHQNSARLLARRSLELILAIAGLLLVSGTGLADSAEEITVEVEDTELSLLRFSASGEHLIIWVSPGFGNH